MFFVHEKKGATGSCDVTLIDYQWSGIAMGVTDIVYLLATSASDGFIKDLDLEEGLLRPYYTAFTSAFESVHKDIDSKAAVLQYSFEELIDDFQLVGQFLVASVARRLPSMLGADRLSIQTWDPIVEARTCCGFC
jgi:hypothetical protein